MFPSGKAIGATITTEGRKFPEQIAPFKKGVVHLLCPAAGKAVGPMPMGEFIAHRMGNRVSARIQELEASVPDPSALPPQLRADGTD